MLLITGATGRVGQELVRSLLKRNEKFRILSHDAANACRVFGKNIEIIEADLTTPLSFPAIERACRGVDCIIHLAALVDYSASEKETMLANFFSTQQLIKAAEMQGEEKKPRFVFLSSTSVYRGTSASLMDEKIQRRASNAYGRSKLAAEKALEKSSLDFIILRSVMIYGKSFHEGFSDVIRRIKEGRMHIIGKGDNIVPFIHVSDVVQAIELAINSKVKREDFIITSGESWTQEGLFADIAKRLGVSAPIKHTPKMLAYLFADFGALKARLTGGKKFYREYIFTLCENRRFSTEKAKRLLKFNPEVKFGNGIKEVLNALGEKK